MREAVFGCFRSGDWRRRALCAVGLGLLVGVVLYGRLILANDPRPLRLTVYAFSTQQEVLSQRILPEFERAWEAKTGQDLVIETMYGPSGTLAGQINLGAPADVVLFSNAQHVEWLKFGQMVRRDTEPVLVGCTPMVIVTRPGNGAQIGEFADLAQPGLSLLHADPRTSGAGEWAVLAEYGSALLDSGDRTFAEAQLEAIWRNVRLLGSSARATLTLFELGAGDALVTYEQDARLAQERGIPLEIVIPGRTILAEHVAVIVDDNVTSAERPAAQALIRYLLSQPGQQAFGDYHLRPGDCGGDGDPLRHFPELARPFTVANLGGWAQAYTQYVEILWQSQIEPRLELEPAPGLLDGGK